MKIKNGRARRTRLRGYDRSWMTAFGWGLVDPTERSFDEWLEFVFNHPVTDPEWYRLGEFDLGWAGDPNRFLAFVTQLFQDPDVLLDKYSAEQIDQGFGYLLGLEGLERWIWEKAIDSTLRTECVMSMVNVFERLFKNASYSDACYMWWDHLRYFGKNPDPKVKEAMLKALSQILEIDSQNCQISALHGLGHIKHSEKSKVIEEFLNSHPELDEKTKSYAKAAMKGRVL
jgi:hypothetical protein